MVKLSPSIKNMYFLSFYSLFFFFLFSHAALIFIFQINHINLTSLTSSLLFVCFCLSFNFSITCNLIIPLVTCHIFLSLVTHIFFFSKTSCSPQLTKLLEFWYTPPSAIPPSLFPAPTFPLPFPQHH